MVIGEWVARLLSGIVWAGILIIAGDWLQTRVLNARRSLWEADERVAEELAAPATRVYLAAAQACADLGWQIHAVDDRRGTLRAINRSPHLGLRNIGLIVQITPFGSGETRVTLALNSPHPGWVRRRFRVATARLIERVRLRALDEPPTSSLRL